MLGEGVNRLRAGRLSLLRPVAECRRVPDIRMLWMWTALMRFAHIPTINSVLSNAGEVRRQSRHVVGVTMEKSSPMTGHDVASELPHSNEVSDQSQVDTP
jgi:hypothetical protein